jgi:hypothetical protein
MNGAVALSTKAPIDRNTPAAAVAAMCVTCDAAVFDYQYAPVRAALQC